jgi:ribose-phosphate pyrophosphokinase
VDLHATQIQGFFDIPVDNLYVAPLFSRDIMDRYGKGSNVTIVSPDVGGVARARAVAKRIDGDLAIIDKRRERAGVSEVMNVIGDVQGRICILLDDIIDSGGTLSNAATALIEKGASEVYAYATHGVLSGRGTEIIAASPIKELVLTDSIQATEEVKNLRKIRVLPIGPLLGEAIHRLALNQSISSLFE